jgi:CDP-paratose 2-epimerase
MMRVLVTGGAGFVGANLAIALAQRHPDWEVLALDNLYRRGSELNLGRLSAAGVSFVHGDVRQPGDLHAAGAVDALVECSAEPSVLAGTGGSPDYVVQTNLLGAYHCLEYARACGARVVFLSTSRVYPVAALRAMRLEEAETRFVIAEQQDLPGVSPEGVSEALPLEGARTVYGTTKLAAELLVAEYAESYGLQAVVDRFGVIAGPWQMGRVDQGVFTYWMLAHVLGRPLRYLGFGGSGKQVRDVLHVEDAVELIDAQLQEMGRWAGMTVNAGGGREVSLSLLETTALCQEITGRTVPVEADGAERAGDVPVYVSDCSRLFGVAPWRPQRSARQVLVDVFEWIRANEREVRAALA